MTATSLQDSRVAAPVTQVQAIDIVLLAGLALFGSIMRIPATKPAAPARERSGAPVVVNPALNPSVTKAAR